MVGCSADPWFEAPSLPDPAVRTEWWQLSLGGRPVGVEERVFGEGSSVTRRRTFSWRAEGRDVVSRSATSVGCDETTCRWTRWEPGSTRSGTARGVIPELWPPASSGVLAVLDPSTGEVTTSAVERDGDRVRWTTPSGPATVWLVDGRPVRARLASFEALRVERPAPIEPVDVARLLAIPVDPWPNARRSLVGEFRVDGVDVRVDAPTWPELPSERDAVRALVSEVADSMTAGFEPGAEAWRAGRGDCTEHALALAERARKAGFEARTAAGRVYLDGPDGPALVLHAWTEIRLGDRWVGADAALRQFPTDASHLRLGEWIADLAALDGARIEIRSLR